MDTGNPTHTLFVDIVLPINLLGTFTYRIPHELNEEVVVGKRVSVPFGKKKVAVGLIYTIHETPPQRYEAKYIFDIVDSEPIVTDSQLSLWTWIANYYSCALGLVYNAAMPAGLKLEATSKVVLSPDHDYSLTFDTTEDTIIQAIQASKELRIEQVAQLIGNPHIHRYIRSLYLKGSILLKEDITESYRPKTVAVISLAPALRKDAELNELLNTLEKRAPKQVNALMFFLSECGMDGAMERADFKQKDISSATIRSLLTKEVFQLENKKVSRLSFSRKVIAIEALEKEQQEAHQDIQSAFERHQPVLLHGVTGSGKTHIYAHLIKEVLDKKQQVLYLLPEIALTTQLIDRLELYFGDRMVVTHSKFSKNERVEVFQRIASGEPSLIVGTRSAVFQPLDNLGLIIVDEEHENSFKQHEPAPRFNARDVALYISAKHKIPIVLGSATPAVESYYNAQQQKYHLVELKQRFDNAILPAIEVVDMQAQKKQKRNKGIFSDTLIDALAVTAANGKQSILFQNKKGYVPVLECNVCAWTPKCKHCDISLTYYKFQNNMRCHYCGYTEPVVQQCAACGNTGIELIGYGTERIEDELQLYLPDLRLARLDQNTTRLKTSHKKIIGAFEAGDIDILIGTQMVAKGLDFENVQTVGVLNADHLLNFPDFRANERTFQLLTQVAGRAGRRSEQGRVFIQTSKPEHPVIRQIVEHNYQGMYTDEILEREQFGYPPFIRLIKITIKHKDALELYKLGQEAQFHYQSYFGALILGPEKPYVSKIRNLYILNFVLKISNDGRSVRTQKARLAEATNKLSKQSNFRTARITLDVDPI